MFDPNEYKPLNLDDEESHSILDTSGMRTHALYQDASVASDDYVEDVNDSIHFVGAE